MSGQILHREVCLLRRDFYCKAYLTVGVVYSSLITVLMTAILLLPQGDSGGPLSCGSGADAELVGITSWGIIGCQTTFPSVYARVSGLRDFVCETTVGIQGC